MLVGMAVGVPMKFQALLPKLRAMSNRNLDSTPDPYTTDSSAATGNPDEYYYPNFSWEPLIFKTWDDLFELYVNLYEESYGESFYADSNPATESYDQWTTNPPNYQATTNGGEQ